MTQQLTRDALHSHKFWAMTADETIAVLESGRSGLSEEEVIQRREFFGPNILNSGNVSSAVLIFLRQFKSPLIFILVIAAALALYLGDVKSGLAILAAVIVNTLLGFYQEHKAEESIRKLKTYLTERVRVVRGSHEFEIMVEDVVPGDIVRLYSGDRVPADGRIILDKNARIDQSVLTGESLPVPKNESVLDVQTVLADRTNMIYAGNLVSDGFLECVITATDEDTEIGKIAMLVSRGVDRETPLQRSIKRFAARATGILFALAVCVFAFGISIGHSPLEMFIIGVAMAVAAVPEGLPIALTVALSVGVVRLAGQKGIVRRLVAAETLGNTSVILTDKTGTITEAAMHIAAVLPLDKRYSEEDVLRTALMSIEILIENPDDDPSQWRVVGKPLEVSLAKDALARGLNFVEVRNNSDIRDHSPFNSSRKFSVSTVHTPDGIKEYFLGAPDILLRHMRGKESDREKMREKISERANVGEKVVGVAVRAVKKGGKSFSEIKQVEDLYLAGLISFHDPLRAGAKEAFAAVTEAGVKTAIVTGDHRGTAEAIAREMGFEIDAESVLEGIDLPLLSDEELRKRLPLIKVFSRVTPEDKLRIVSAYQAAGEVVAMTGDGVNDAPSIKRSDIGIAVGTATDVTKDVADLVILNNNFATITAAIAEGRVITENVRKITVYLLSNSLDTLILIGGALLMGFALPLGALQILWVNFFSDSFPAIALAFERGVDGIGTKPKKIPKNLLDGEMKFLVLVIGTLTSVLLFAMYVLLLRFGFDEDKTQTFIFMSFGTYSLFLVFAVKSLTKSILSYRVFTNVWLVLSVIFGFALMLAAVYIPFLQDFLGTTALTPLWLAGVAGFGALNIFLIELVKYFYRTRGI